MAEGICGFIPMPWAYVLFFWANDKINYQGKLYNFQWDENRFIFWASELLFVDTKLNGK